ncbi:MAG: adenosylmethionine decarboxylase [Candidatus Babeliales bacterium]
MVFLFLVVNCLFSSLHAACSVDRLKQFIEKESCNYDSSFFHKLGDHFIAEFMDCHEKLENLTNIEELEKIIGHAAQAAGATVLTIKSFAFPPMPWVGMTSVAVLQESHISVHTWPQYGYIALDIFTCGDHVHIEKALAVLEQFFQPKRISFIKLDRGFTDDPYFLTPVLNT